MAGRAAALVPVDLRVVSYNVRGLNGPEKRRRLLRDLATLRTSVAFLQETHFCSTSPPALRDRRFPTGYFDHNPTSKSRGTAILFANSVPFQLQDSHTAGDGRCIFVKGDVAGSKYTFANLYLPNTNQHKYLAKALCTLEAFAEGMLILGGDFNIPMNPKEDSSSALHRIPRRTLRRIHLSLQALRLVDVWRAHHPSTRDYTYFSSVHNTYTRLDYFYVPQYNLPLIRSAEIQATTWSDHAPVVITVASPLLRPREGSWQLNTSLLTDPLLVSEIQESIKTYFSDNRDGAVPPPTVWEAHKAVLRGRLISLASCKARERRKEIEELHTEIRQLEIEHQLTGDAVTYTRLLHSRTQLANTLNPRLQRAMLQTKCYFALHEDKPGRLLARLLRQRRRQTYIPTVRPAAGPPTLDPTEIVRAFRDYYSSLYHSVEEAGTPSSQSLADYLATRIPHRLTDEQRAPLGLPFTAEEITQTIKRQKNGKTPGPDGFPALYYKRFGQILTPHMAETFNALISDHSFHPHSLAATIVVIPKEGKDPQLCSSYRPISLLNSDLKIFAAALARRLQPVLPSLVRKDQVGFIPAREARDGTIRTLNVMQRARLSETPMLLLSTDAEKAFDRVSWPFMFATLRAMNLPLKFITWIASLYSAPNAKVRVNGISSESLQIRNGTRQGCPLSPILFALALEPFLESIRSNTSIPGLEGTSYTHKVSAYADDLLFYVPDPLTTLPIIVEEFRLYGHLANLKLNMDKSEILNLSVPEAMERILRRTHPFVWCSSRLKYLGLWLTRSPHDLFKENFPPLWAAICRDLTSWKPLKVSWIGKINILKMNTLPRLLYLFQTLPIHVPPTFLAEIQSYCSRFVWSSGRARVNRHTLSRPKSAGGLALPDFTLYYQAAHLVRVVEWSTGGRRALWQDLEWGATPLRAGVLPWIAPKHRSPLLQAHPFIGATLRTWKSVLRRRPLSSYPSPMLPLSGNPDFSVGVHPCLRRRLEPSTALKALHFLSGPDLLPPWDRPSQTTAPSPLERFNFSQISHYLLSLPARHRLLRPPTPFETLCLAGRPLRHGVSVIYGLLQISPAPDPPSFEHTWERMLDITIAEEQWRDTYEFTHHGSPQTRLQSTSYKLLTLWYSTPSLLFRMGLRITPNCWRCDDPRGTYLHVWWECPVISPFWRLVRDTVTTVTDLDLPLTPETFLLTHVRCPVTTFKRSVALPMLMTARLIIARSWRSESPPSYRDWLARMEEVRNQEDLVARTEGKLEAHLHKWYHWCAYLPSAECRDRAGT
uniref:Reverse transcriptase domain-containing protein n=1 Tax=Leptobrachium leishanense TaxID=445787 RepID=A0A8C5PW08_9ANUR